MSDDVRTVVHDIANAISIALVACTWAVVIGLGCTAVWIWFRV
jgi:hypothetical protein